MLYIDTHIIKKQTFDMFELLYVQYLLTFAGRRWINSQGAPLMPCEFFLVALKHAAAGLVLLLSLLLVHPSPNLENI